MMLKLLEQLQATGIPFAMDAWEGKAPDGDYGVVEPDANLGSSAAALWGDDGCVEQVISGNVVLYTFTHDQVNAQIVQDVIRRAGYSWKLMSNNYLQDINANRYTWRIEQIVNPGAI